MWNKVGHKDAKCQLFMAYNIFETVRAHSCGLTIFSSRVLQVTTSYSVQEKNRT